MDSQTINPSFLSQPLTAQSIRQVMGDRAKNLSDQQIEKLINAFQPLVRDWMDDWEQQNLGFTLRSQTTLLNNKL